LTGSSSYIGFIGRSFKFSFPSAHKNHVPNIYAQQFPIIFLEDILLTWQVISKKIMAES